MKQISKKTIIYILLIATLIFAVAFFPVTYSAYKSETETDYLQTTFDYNFYFGTSLVGDEYEYSKDSLDKTIEYSSEDIHATANSAGSFTFSVYNYKSAMLISDVDIVYTVELAEASGISDADDIQLVDKNGAIIDESSTNKLSKGVKQSENITIVLPDFATDSDTIEFIVTLVATAYDSEALPYTQTYNAKFIIHKEDTYSQTNFSYGITTTTNYSETLWVTASNQQAQTVTITIADDSSIIFNDSTSEITTTLKAGETQKFTILKQNATDEIIVTHEEADNNQIKITATVKSQVTEE